MVRMRGLEPLRLSTLDPKSNVSAIPPHPHETDEPSEEIRYTLT